MRVRALDANGDMTWGRGSGNFLVDSPEFVRQKVLTGLGLWRGEFFLNTSAGMPWSTEVLGKNTQAFYDAAIQKQVLSTSGVTGINSYSSSFDAVTRLLSVSMRVQTQFGAITITTTFAPPRTSGFGIGGFGTIPFGQ